MRTIKFRGKDIETGKWVYGFYVRLEDTFRKPIEGKERITNRIYTGSADRCVAPTTGYDFSGDWYEVDQNTVGQFTGLYDCNGREIYEDDIVDLDYIIYDPWDDAEESLEPMRCVVVYEDFGFRFKKEEDLSYFLHDVKNIKVICNIHDNPELMKGGKDVL